MVSHLLARPLTSRDEDATRHRHSEPLSSASVARALPRIGVWVHLFGCGRVRRRAWVRSRAAAQLCSHFTPAECAFRAARVGSRRPYSAEGALRPKNLS
jgi:hypothetical protein